MTPSLTTNSPANPVLLPVRVRVPVPFLITFPLAVAVNTEAFVSPAGLLMVRVLPPHTKLPAVPARDLIVWSKPLRLRLPPAAMGDTTHVFGITPAAPHWTVVVPPISRPALQSLPVLERMVMPPPPAGCNVSLPVP